MIFKISWRNIWRSKSRSLTVVGSIVVGVWALTFIMAFYEGFVNMYITSAVENDLSHIQIHNPKFGDEKEVQYTLANPDEIRALVQNTAGVKAFTSRSLISGMIANSKGSRGCQIRGVKPVEEAQLTKLNQKIIEGAYFSESKKKNPIIVGEALAGKMKLKIKSKVVLTFQTPNGDLTSASFKVIGIYKGGNDNFEELNLFVQQEDVSRLVGDPKLTHEVAFLVDDVEEMTRIQSELAAKFPNALVETYAEISPDINLYESQMGFISYIIVVIVMFALIFGIINVMLMAILERTRELGMLMAVGMNKSKVFLMIIIETVCIGMIAAPIGLLFGFLTVSYYGYVGIDMTEGMGKIIAEIIYPELDIKTYLTITIAVAITAVLGALYPALKAISLKPVDAIHSL
jgi:putative ABC transport system permease protein